MVKLVLVDAGHGIDTQGKCSPDGTYKEYKYAREIAKEVVYTINFWGYESKLLVPELSDVSLKDRCDRVNTYCDDLGKDNVLLLSIHTNAAGNQGRWMTARGWSAYTTRGVTEADKYARCLYEAAEEFHKGQKIRKYSNDKYGWDFEEDFYICRHTKCPAVLTENFFHDNKQDLEYILSDQGRLNIINTLASGTVRYITGF